MADDPQPPSPASNPPPPPIPSVPPPPPPSPAIPPGYAPVERAWRSLRGLTTALTWLFAADGVASLVVAVALGNRIRVVNDIDNHGFSFDLLNRAQDADDFATGAGVAFALCALATAVCFIIWFWRAAKNNEALGREKPRLGPGWAIGGWFIPLANFVIPVLIAQDLWRGSDPSVPRGDSRWRIGPRSALVGWWWGLCLLSLVRVGAGSSADERHPTLSDIRSSNIRALIGMLFSIGASILAILVVRRITQRQEECLLAQQAAWSAEHGQPPPMAR
jgi:hypothetical protein